MAVEDSQNPLQAGLQNLGDWFNSLPRPHVRLPWQQDNRDSSPSSSSASTAQHEGGSISYSSQAAAPTAFRAQSSPKAPIHAPQVGPVDKDGLGRATWTFLHVLAAQFPERPTKSQQKDVRSLVDVLTRIYPCAECAEHFREVVRHHPPKVESGATLRLWMCEVHNEVNKSISKPNFNCKFVDSRWGALDCGDQLACALPSAK